MLLLQKRHTEPVNVEKMPRRQITRRRRRITRRPEPDHNLKFNRLTRAVIYRALEQRLPQTRAAELAGIAYSTYRDWLKRGLDPEEGVYRAFRVKVKQLLASVEVESLEIIRRSAKGGDKYYETKVAIDPRGQSVTKTTKERLPQWQAAAWFLERRFKKDYGRDPYDMFGERSPEEAAREIKDAADMLFDSVPLGPTDLEASSGAI